MFGLSDEEIEVKVFNKKTGQEIKVVKFVGKSECRWEKVVAKQLASMLSIDGNSSTKFISYLISAKDDNNRVFGNYTELAMEASVSVDTVKKLMPKLKRHGFVKGIHRSGIYMIDPKTIRPGERWKGSVLVQVWEDL